MRRKFGELDAGQLEGYFDPGCLTGLMGRHYVQCRRWERRRETSHCWNVRCGRWAYKALGDRWVPRRRRRRGGDGVGMDNGGDEGGNVSRGNDEEGGALDVDDSHRIPFSIESLLPPLPEAPSKLADMHASPLGKIRRTLERASSQLSRTRCLDTYPQSCQEIGSLAPFSLEGGMGNRLTVSRMKMCSSCRRAKYCSKLCQVYDWRSGRHKMECQFL